MRCVWATDIHLNFLDASGRRRFADTLRAARPDALLLSGDIGEADTVGTYLMELEHRLEGPIYFVLGNHDFYRGSIHAVRKAIEEVTRRFERLRWMNSAGVVRLGEATALVGHDSWADGRLGNAAGTDVELTDFWLIEELCTENRAERLQRMRVLADEAAGHFARVLPEALEVAESVVVLTHVPPFADAAWHEGATSADDWLPFFATRAVGEVLVSVMEQHPDCDLTVLCGHTHGTGTYSPLPNLTVHTGGATYGEPAVQRILEID